MIKNSLTRFISIALISFLGAGIFAGLAAVAPNMKQAGDQYYDDQNTMDVRILSTCGFSEEDVQAVGNTPGVSDVTPGYFLDVAGTVDDKDYTFRINSLPQQSGAAGENNINQLQLIDGRLPQSDHEAVVIESPLGLKNISLGSTVCLNPSSNQSFAGSMNRDTYTIVGIAQTPNYMFFMQGNTLVGRGTLDYILYVPEGNFTANGYTDLYATISGAKNLNTFEDAYFEQTAPTIERLQTLADQRKTLHYDQLQSSLNQAEQEYEQNAQQISQRFADAKLQLDAAAAELTSAKEEYQKGLREYTLQKQAAEQALQDAKAKLDAAAEKISSSEILLNDQIAQFASKQEELNASREQLDRGWNEYFNKTAELNSAKETLGVNKAALEEAQTQYESLSTLAAIKAARDAQTPGTPEYENLNVIYQAALHAAGLTEEQAAEKIAALPEMKQKLDQQWAQYYAAEASISQSEAQLNFAKQTLDQNQAFYSTAYAQLEGARQQLNNAQAELQAGKNEYQAGLDEYNAQAAAAHTQFANAANSLNLAAEQISSGEAQLTEQQNEYNAKKAEAETGLLEAKEQITSAQQQFSSLGAPQWYVLDRKMNEAFLNYYDDTQRMHDLATVFPVIFFLVAALVCLTTMTRMVDEDRTLIGTLKALGYSNRQIAGRYLQYASAACLIGSVSGVFAGFWLLPSVVWNAYGIVFKLPELSPAFYPGIALLSVLSTLLIICLATAASVKKSLSETPTELMRPRAPKPGKRVLLERMSPIWNRLSFSAKVTVRNLALNKKRLLMTLVGIIGCTALMLTAFGAKNAVQSIVDKQIGEVFHYSASVGFENEHPSDELYTLLSNPEYFEKSTEELQSSAEVQLPNDPGKTSNVYLVSPKNAADFSSYVTFSNPKTHQEFEFTDNSVVITEKLAMNLGVGIGDVITIKDVNAGRQHMASITDVTTNYAMNYVYLGKSAYRQAFGKEPAYNQLLTISANHHTNDEIKTYLSQAPDTGVVSFMEDQMGNIKTSIQSVDIIIWILIIASGLLAFVVVYNLTNINIGERQRELATLKVLGFYDKESYRYIFRETIIVAVAGCILGLIGGVFLYQAVISTVEPDMIFLDRQIGWLGYLLAAILTMVFTLLVNQCLKPKIKHINMLESLKSVE